MSAFARAREGFGVGTVGGPRSADVAPSAGILWGIALAGVAAAICVVVLRVTSDHGGAEPGLQAALLDWIVCSLRPQRPDRVVATPGEPLWAADGGRRVRDRALQPLVGERGAAVHDRRGAPT